MIADDPRPAGEAWRHVCDDLPFPLGRRCCGAPDSTACHQRGLCWMEGVHPDSPGFIPRPAASGGATDGERCECGKRLTSDEETTSGLCLRCLNGPVHPILGRPLHSAPAASQAADELTALTEEMGLYAPAASQADGELRELREVLERTIHAGVVRQWQGSMRDDVALTDPRPIVREIFALPAVRQLLADAATVQRVRELLTHDEHLDSYEERQFRRALDGER